MKKTIQKVLNELKQEKPDLSYIRGLLEGLVEEEPVNYALANKLPTPTYAGPTNSSFTKADEEEIIPAAAQVGPVGHIA